MTRSEHMAWCKQRALEYVEVDDPSQAVASMLSDLGKHEETAKVTRMGFALTMIDMDIHTDTAKARKWIEGFN